MLMFTGDSKFCGRTAARIAAQGLDYPFALVTAVLESADITFGNCETAITSCSTPSPGKPRSAVASGKAFVFKSEPECCKAVLEAAGFDVLQLANNHAMDYGEAGMLETLSSLDAAGIAHIGAGANAAAAAEPLVLEAQGLRVGFLAYSLIVPPASRAQADAPGINTLPADYGQALARDIGALRESCNLVVVGMHWGKESHCSPSEMQRRVGHAAIDAGADLVIGSHPHSLQGLEFYGDGLIAYSLGNFVFTGASPLLSGCILRITVSREGDAGQARVEEAALLPCWIRDGRPEPSGEARLARQIGAVMKRTGTCLGEGEDGWLILQDSRLLNTATAQSAAVQ